MRSDGREMSHMGLTNSDLGVGNQRVHVASDVLNKHFGPLLVIARILQQRQIHFLQNRGNLLQRLGSKLDNLNLLKLKKSEKSGSKMSRKSIARC